MLSFTGRAISSICNVPNQSKLLDVLNSFYFDSKQRKYYFTGNGNKGAT